MKIKKNNNKEIKTIKKVYVHSIVMYPMYKGT